jgi:hypothetical protein
MAIVPAQGTPIGYRTAISLEEYAAFIDYDECTFFGVRGPNFQQNQCKDIWTLRERNNLSRYLAEAQEEIEDEVGYLLSPTWIVGRREDEPTLNERFVDTRFPDLSFNTRWNKIIGLGQRAETDVALAGAVDNTSDPAIVGPFATTVTDIHELHVFHPGSDIEINPSNITISGGFATITIPRCRLVTIAASDNDENGLDYDDLANFESTVDVKRVYNDTAANQAYIECQSAGDCNCTVTSQFMCGTVLNYRLGTIQIDRTRYRCCSGCGHTNVVGLYYYSGDQYLPLKGREAIIRLSHSKMPTEPCGCDVTSRLWKRDRKIPDVMTTDRAQCPFGINDGAWVAWQWAKTMKHTRIGSL